MSTNNNINGTKSDDDRIDDIARAAGQALRRPAPARGLEGVHSTTRRRKTTRAAVGGGAAVLLFGIGAFALTRGDDDRTVVPAVTTAPTTAPTTTPPTAVSTTDVPPNGAGAPEVIYATTVGIASPDYLQHLIDPLTGEELSTGAPDGDASLAAQMAQIDAAVVDGQLDEAVHQGVIGYRFEIGDIAYGYEVRFTDSPDLPDEDPAVLALFDRCGQSELTVEGATGATTPTRIQRAAVSLDRHWIATVGTECPVDGTLVGQGSVVIAATEVTVFDAAHPEQAGVVLMTADSGEISGLFFSPDGSYLAVEGGGSYRVFDLSDGSEIEFAPSGCDAVGGRYARFAGPWVGESTLVLSLSCPTAGASLLVVDVATGEELSVPVPGGNASDTTYATVEVDGEHFDTPDNAWFTICSFDGESPRCWFGQGSNEPVLIPDVTDASFLPLGFTFGG